MAPTIDGVGRGTSSEPAETMVPSAPRNCAGDVHAGVRTSARSGRACSARLAGQLAERVHDEHGIAGLGRRRPLLGRGSGGVAVGSRRMVINSVPDTPSTMQWCTFETIAQRSSVKPFDHPRLPQRPVAVELLGHQPTHEVVEIRLGPGRRERGVADVVLEVEVRVVDPHRPAETPGTKRTFCR